MKIGECKVCGKKSKLTNGHVIPRVWFADPKPQDLWVIDECLSCNRSHEEGDIQIRDFVVGQIDPRNLSQASTLWQKSIRAFSKKRSRVLDSLSRTSVKVDVVNEHGLWMGKTHRGVVPADLIDKSLEHLGRRLTAYDRNCVVHNMHVDAKFMNAQGVQSLLNDMLSLGAAPLAGFRRDDRIAPEVRLTRMLDAKNKYSGTWLISFYNQQMGIRIITQPET